MLPQDRNGRRYGSMGHLAGGGSAGKPTVVGLTPIRRPIDEPSATSMFTSISRAGPTAGASEDPRVWASTQAATVLLSSFIATSGDSYQASLVNAAQAIDADFDRLAFAI